MVDVRLLISDLNIEYYLIAEGQGPKGYFWNMIVIINAVRTVNELMFLK